MKKFNLLQRTEAILLCVVMILSLFIGLPVKVQAAESDEGNQQEENQNAESERPEGYIRIADFSKPDGDYQYTMKYLYNAWYTEPSDYENPYGDMSYDKATNTLTMTNANNPKLALFLDGMDMDF